MTFPQSASWRAISTSLATDSDRWRSISNDARVMWIQMMLRCDNHGTLEGDDYVIWSSCAKRLGFTESQGRDAINELERIGLIIRWNDDAGMDWAHIIGFDDHQPSEYIRKRGKRRSPIPPADRTPESTPAQLRSEGRSQKKKEKEKKKEKKNIVEASTSESTTASSEIQQVFDHWIKIDVATGGGSAAGRILNSSRREKIRARLAEGYTVEQLQNAITAFCNDPWHQGKNDRRTRYTGLTTILKNGEKVEAGLRMLDNDHVIQRSISRESYVKPQIIV